MSAGALPPRYEPKAVEAPLYERWMRETNRFHADPDDPRRPFVIVIPPPNVTGSLHLGHALDNTLQDLLVRHQRMAGNNACWVPGTDHAGIGTQVVVERELKKEGLTRHDLGREKFLERVWRWKESSGDRIIEQLKLMGCSCDWDRQRFTMDEGLTRAVREHFVRLHEDGLIYRAERMVNWCPRCQTALSDLEVKHQDQKGSLWHLRYPLEGGGEVVLATTRPETVLGDTAVAVHPEDGRYRGIVGRRAVLPLVDRKIPVIADDCVDRAFGTGVVKITPAHDPNDFAVGKRHGLEIVNIMNADATLNERAGPYRGLDRGKARDRVLADLQAGGFLVRTEPHISAVGRCDRCSSVLEPLPSKQWWVKTGPLAAEAVKAVEDGRIRLVPDNAPAVFNEWMRNIQDWCISRQIWWGHRIPAWYCRSCGKTVVSREDPDACDACGGALDRDPDTLDTWFSSALWPFSTLGWPGSSRELERFYPTSVLVTGWDILFFWVARMMMAGLKLTGTVPFRTVVLHSLITDPEGKKMSKSKGNVLDPLELFDRYGTDACRFTLVRLETMRQSFRLSADRVEHGRNFMNKVWNAARFVLGELEGFDPAAPKPALTDADRWILGKTQLAVSSATKAVGDYYFSGYAGHLEKFFWNDFCDVYIELAKPELKDAAARPGAQWTLYLVLDTAMRLLHPVVPYITEEIWQRLPRKPEDPGLLMLAAWPKPDEDERFRDAVALFDFTVLPVIEAVRSLRHEMGVPPAGTVSVTALPNGDAELRPQQRQRDIAAHARTLARADLTFAAAGDRMPAYSVSAVTPGYVLHLELDKPADPAAERGRLAREQDQLQALLNRTLATLKSEDYLAKAPPELVEQSRKKAADYEARLVRLAERIRQLA